MLKLIVMIFQNDLFAQYYVWSKQDINYTVIHRHDMHAVCMIWMMVVYSGQHKHGNKRELDHVVIGGVNSEGPGHLNILLRGPIPQ